MAFLVCLRIHPLLRCGTALSVRDPPTSIMNQDAIPEACLHPRWLEHVSSWQTNQHIRECLELLSSYCECLWEHSPVWKSLLPWNEMSMLLSCSLGVLQLLCLWGVHSSAEEKAVLYTGMLLSQLQYEFWTLTCLQINWGKLFHHLRIVSLLWIMVFKNFYLFWVYPCVPFVCLVPMKARRGHWMPGARVKRPCSQGVGVVNLPGLLEVQPVHLNTELYLWSL